MQQRVACVGLILGCFGAGLGTRDVFRRGVDPKIKVYDGHCWLRISKTHMTFRQPRARHVLIAPIPAWGRKIQGPPCPQRRAADASLHQLLRNTDLYQVD
jgi:hypothetical protein